MYKGNRQRFTRNALESVADAARKAFFKCINPTNLIRLQKTLDLSDVDSDKPSINSVMIPIQERIDEEERLEQIEMARRWAKHGWSQRMVYDCMGEEDYLMDEDEGIILNAKQLKKLNKKLSKGKSSSKRGSRGKGKRPDKVEYGGYEDFSEDYWENRKSMYTHGEWIDDEDNYEEAYKKIKFYPDITNELSVIEFDSLKEFSDYCNEHGYLVGTTDFDNLKNWGTVHCCLDPIDLEYGDYSIITDTSYGGLYWTVEADLPDDVKEAVNSQTSSNK